MNRAASSVVANASDLLELDHELREGELEMRDSVRAFVDRRIRSNIAVWYDEGVFPLELVPEMAELGLLGMHIEGYGCAGKSAVEYGLAMQELEAGDSGIRTFVSVQGSLAMSAIAKHGSEEQKQTWLPRMAAGEVIGCFGLTEPTAGSDPSSMLTTARRNGDAWVIDGTKRWIGLASIAHLAIIWAMTDEGVRGFIVPTNSEGFRAVPIAQKLSMRASIQCDITLEGVRVPADAILPGAMGLSGPFSCLNEARYGIAWGGGRCSERQLRRGARLRAAAAAIRQAARRLPAHAEEARRLGARDPEGATRGAAPRTPQGRGNAAAPHDLRCEVEQHPNRDRDRTGRPQRAGRQRRHARLLAAAACEQPRVSAHL